MEERCVYAWVNETNFEPFYVGCGTIDRPRRLTSRSKAFFKIYNNNKCHYIILKRGLSPVEAAMLEREVIRDYREQGCNLVNQTNGGEMKNVEWTQEMRDEYAERLKGENNPNFGHHWTDEMKDHLSELRINNGLAKGGMNPRAMPVMCVETCVIYACKEDATEFLGVKSGCGSIYFCLKNPKRVAGKGKYHFVGQDMFEKLNTEEKRKEWLEKVAS